MANIKIMIGVVFNSYGCKIRAIAGAAATTNSARIQKAFSIRARLFRFSFFFVSIVIGNLERYCVRI